MLIFICYRHSDSQHAADRIDGRLVRTFGRKNVVKDVYAIRAGYVVREVILDLVDKCDVLLVVIGPRWLNAVDSQGRRRLDNPDDYIRCEIESALARRVRLIPILVDGATHPSETELPDSLRPLANRLSINIRPDPHFETDAGQLVKDLKPERKPIKVPWRPLAVATALILCVTLAVVFGPATLDAASQYVARLRARNAEPNNPPIAGASQTKKKNDDAAARKPDSIHGPLEKMGRVVGDDGKRGTEKLKVLDQASGAPTTKDLAVEQSLLALFALKPSGVNSVKIWLVINGDVDANEIKNLTDACKEAKAAVTHLSFFYDNPSSIQRTLFRRAIEEAGHHCRISFITHQLNGDPVDVPEPPAVVVDTKRSPPKVGPLDTDQSPPTRGEHVQVIVGRGGASNGFDDPRAANYLLGWDLRTTKLNVYIAPSASYLASGEAPRADVEKILKDTRKSTGRRVTLRGEDDLADLAAFLTFDRQLSEASTRLFGLKPAAEKPMKVALLVNGYVTANELAELADACKQAGATVTTLARWGNLMYDHRYRDQVELIEKVIKEVGAPCEMAHFNLARLAEDVIDLDGKFQDPYPPVKEDVLILIGGGADKEGVPEQQEQTFISKYTSEKHKDVYVAQSASFPGWERVPAELILGPRVILKGRVQFSDLPAFLKWRQEHVMTPPERPRPDAAKADSGPR